MADTNKINSINRIIKSYFESNKSASKVAAKDLMPEFLKACIFPADHKGGLPIRKLLRELDSKNQLHLIPFVLAERKQANTNWFFVRTSYVQPLIPKREINKPALPKTNNSRKNSDESYVIDLCDEILNQKALRQHRFDFLRGDAGKNGNRAKLPVDAYYHELSLVVEYCENQHTQPVKHFDKPDVMTVSGVHRGEQRRIYDERRKEILPKYGKVLIEIPYTAFNYDNRNRIIRNYERDKEVIKTLLKKYK